MLRRFLPLLLLPLLLAGEAWAENWHRQLREFIPIAISEDRAVEIARDITGGRILSVETDNRNGRKIYLIRILEGQQRVRRLRVDAETGELLRSKTQFSRERDRPRRNRSR